MAEVAVIGAGHAGVEAAFALAFSLTVYYLDAKKAER